MIGYKKKKGRKNNSSKSRDNTPSTGNVANDLSFAEMLAEAEAVQDQVELSGVGKKGRPKRMVALDDTIQTAMSILLKPLPWIMPSRKGIRLR